METFEHRAHAADHLARPQFLAQQDELAILEPANGAQEITWIGFVVSINTPSSQISFQSRITLNNQVACSRAERLALEAIEEQLEGFDFRRGNDDRLAGRFVKANLVALAENRAPGRGD